MALGKYVLVTAALVSMTSVASVAQAEQTRQIAGGDLLYAATASASTEADALLQAEGRAIHLLAVECSVPPTATKIFRQAVRKSAMRLGQFEATVELGVALFDCEATLRAPLDRKPALTNAELAATLKSYEARFVDLKPAASATPAYTYVFTAEQERGAERALDRKAADREALRENLRAEASRESRL